MTQLLTSCDFVGDEGCVDANCWQCHPWFSVEKLRTLAHNLSIAGALCEVWYSALDEAEDHRLYHEHGYRTVECWHPGCQKEAP